MPRTAAIMPYPPRVFLERRSLQSLGVYHVLGAASGTFVPDERLFVEERHFARAHQTKEPGLPGFREIKTTEFGQNVDAAWRVIQEQPLTAHSRHADKNIQVAAETSSSILWV